MYWSFMSFLFLLKKNVPIYLFVILNLLFAGRCTSYILYFAGKGSRFFDSMSN